jgi:RNA polymerase sporulation-specific sigma factor
MNGGRELLAAAAAGGREAAALLLEGNARLVWRMVHRFRAFAKAKGFEAPEAEDLYQQACCIFLGQLKNYNSAFETALSTFMYQRVHYGLMDYSLGLRREAARQAPLESLPDSSPGGFSGEAGASGRLLEAENRECLREAIGRLPLREREIINARYMRGITQKECGRVFRTQQSQISRLEARALSRLRAFLEEGGGAGRPPGLKELNRRAAGLAPRLRPLAGLRLPGLRLPGSGGRRARA